MGTTIFSSYRAIGILGVLFIIYACLVTKDSTESSSETVQNTSDATSDFTSSTSPGDDSSESAKKEQTLAFSNA